MTNPDCKALCAELVVIEDAMSGGSVQLSSQGQALDGYAALAAFRYIAAKARIALAQPEPEGPTDDAIFAEATKFLYFSFAHMGDPNKWDGTDADLLAFARSILARWGTPANAINQEALPNG